MLKLLLFFGGIAALFALVVTSVASYLSVDDLAKCSAPNPLVARCAPADAIIAVSGGDTPARAQEAIALYQAGWAPQLVFSGAALDKSGPSNAAAMRKQALAAGVPENAVMVEETAVDTTENARNTLRLLTGAKRIILVTSPYHQHRAALEFSKIFGDTVEVVNHPTQSDHAWPPTWYLTSSGWWLAISETVKTFVVSL